MSARTAAAGKLRSVPPAAVTLVHAIPGRLRLRIGIHTDGPALQRALAARPGILASSWSERTRTILVRYAPDRMATEDLLACVGAVTLAVPTARPDPVASAPAAGPSLLAAGVTRALTEINTAIRRSTGGWLDLGTLFPLALGAWAVRELVRGQVAPLAWSSALWYAHSLFRDYSLPEPGASGDD